MDTTLYLLDGLFFRDCDLRFSEIPNIVHIVSFTGIASSVSPMYYTELAPVKLRGMFGCLHQLFITLGILFSQIIGLPDILGTATRWPYIFGLSMLPCIFQAVTMPLCPESPKAWYIDRGDPDKAMKGCFRCSLFAQTSQAALLFGFSTAVAARPRRRQR